MVSLGRALDRLIYEVAPQWARRRAAARAHWELIERAREQNRNRLPGRPHRLGGRSRYARMGPRAIADRDLEASRAQARDLYRFNPFAKGTVRSIAANLIGKGIHPRPMVQALLGEAFNERAAEAWKTWSRGVDTTGRKSISDQQDLMMRECYSAGECLGVLSTVRDGRETPLALDVVPGERLALIDRDLSGGRRILQGIEFSSSRQIVAYHLYPEHPNEAFSASQEPERIEASRVLHLFFEEEAGQVRGLTRLLTVADTFEAMWQWLDWVFAKERVASAFALMLTQDSLPIEFPKTGDDDDLEDDEGNKIGLLEGGIIWEAKPGQDAKAISSGVQGANTESLARLQFQIIARGLDVSYELVSKDLSRVTYLSARQGRQEAVRGWEPQQERMIEKVLCPLWAAFVEAGSTAGVLPSIGQADLERFCRVDWIRPGWDWIDPQRDVKSDIEAMRAGQRSPVECVARRGGDIWRVLDDLAAVKQKAEELGLELSIFQPEPGTPVGEADNGDNQDEDQEAPVEAEAA